MANKMFVSILVLIMLCGCGKEENKIELWKGASSEELEGITATPCEFTPVIEEDDEITMEFLKSKIP
jgi:hypothetical protein